MKNAEALERAIKAVEKSWRDSDAFDHGGMASHEILDIIRESLKEEFAK